MVNLATLDHYQAPQEDWEDVSIDHVKWKPYNLQPTI